MHPLDSKLDTHFGKHEKKALRRTSIDNSSLQDNQEILTKMFSGSNCLDSSSHGPAIRRRLSLNNVQAKATTFLANAVRDVSKHRTELDEDYHIGDDEEFPDNNSGMFQSSFGELSKHVISEDEENEDSLESDDGDSFCEASGAEPANQDYIVKELGASCYWDGDIDGEHMTDDDLAEFEALENGEHEQGTERELLNLDELTDEHSDCDSFCDATDKEPANRDYLVRDLGASCFWNSKGDGFDDDFAPPRRTVAQISEEEAQ